MTLIVSSAGGGCTRFTRCVCQLIDDHALSALPFRLFICNELTFGTLLLRDLSLTSCQTNALRCQTQKNELKTSASRSNTLKGLFSLHCIQMCSRFTEIDRDVRIMINPVSFVNLKGAEDEKRIKMKNKIIGSYGTRNLSMNQKQITLQGLGLFSGFKTIFANNIEQSRSVGASCTPV